MLKISDTAIQEFKNIIQELNQPEAGIRVYIRGEGCCSGPSVGLDLSREPESPFSTHLYSGLKVFIEDEAFDRIAHATIDYFPHAENPGFRLLWDKTAKPGGCGCG